MLRIKRYHGLPGRVIKRGPGYTDIIGRAEVSSVVHIIYK